MLLSDDLLQPFLPALNTHIQLVSQNALLDSIHHHSNNGCIARTPGWGGGGTCICISVEYIN